MRAECCRRETTDGWFNNRLETTCQENRPDIPRQHADRFDACQMAIEGELIEFVDRASDRGRHRDEVLEAIIAVADNLALERREGLAIAIEMRVRQMTKKREV